MERPFPGCGQYIRESFVKRGLPQNGMESVLASISESTKIQYSSYLSKWWAFCISQRVDPFILDLERIVEFLNQNFNKGASYATINSCKSSLSLIFEFSEQQKNYLKRYIKGIYNRRPSYPKYETTWDPSNVLQFLEGLGNNKTIPLEKLSKKLVALLALTTGHRIQTLSKISLENIKITDNCIWIKIPDRLKTSRKNMYQPLLKFKFFEVNPKLCVARTIIDYINRTKEIRPLNEKTLILTFRKPFRKATTQTLSRWLKNILKDSGIDTSLFTGYSFRHASTSAAYRSGINIETIRKAAGWSNKSETFVKFYNRPVAGIEQNFSDGILQGNNT